MSAVGMHEPLMVTAQDALPGRTVRMPALGGQEIPGAPLRPPYPAGTRVAEFALGCFWGAEQRFWRIPGVVLTAVGYEGGITPNPTYEEVCSGRTGHAETVRAVFDPDKVSYAELLTAFWESHDPTQGMRQGNDSGTQYRSVVFYHSPEQESAARQSLGIFQRRLAAAGYGQITTEILPAWEFYFAENDHQRYLARNPDGYCGLDGTGVSCPARLVGAGG